MKERKYKQCILCEGKDLAESVGIFNNVMKERGIKEPDFERVGDKFLVYITVTEQEPESLAEEMELKGCDHNCIECRHCERTMNRYGKPDERLRKALCTKKGKKIYIDSPVCDTFYKEYQDNRPFEIIKKRPKDINGVSKVDEKGA